MDERTTYKAARFFRKRPTLCPEPLWFVAYPGQLHKDAALYNWRTGLEQKQVYYMDAARSVPMAEVRYNYDTHTQIATQTWRWAIGYADAWQEADPIPITHTPLAFESLLREGRQRILNYLMVQARQAFGDKADARISLFYGRYYRELLSWTQRGRTEAFQQALDRDLAQTSSEGKALRAILNTPLSCKDIPAAFQGKRVVDYIRHYIRFVGPYSRNYVHKPAAQKPLYLGRLYVHPRTDYTALGAKKPTAPKAN